jgi:hypothetical protein
MCSPTAQSKHTKQPAEDTYAHELELRFLLASSLPANHGSLLLVGYISHNDRSSPQPQPPWRQFEEDNPSSFLTAVAPFWAKGQPYALRHIFRGDPMKEEVYRHFIGGTLYQTFLSATCYNRWHSPINGTIVRSWKVPGTYYYAEAPYIHDDDSAPNESQGFIAEVATRSITFIQADNPAIGLMAFVAIGMTEVST